MTKFCITIDLEEYTLYAGVQVSGGPRPSVFEFGPSHW